MPPTSIPSVLAGRYRLGETLGRGGMGEVRAAVDLRLDRPVAVKLLREDLADRAELRARFEREARAAARLSHPNVVAVYDTGEEREIPYIVMEQLPGDTLADQLAGGPLSETRACEVVVEILAAVAAAHELDVLHRDIKPGNVLRAADGRAKVSDFGIAKIAQDPGPTTTGLFLGTAAYLAPERVAGEPATVASDIYSVGVVLFEALAGRPPFVADTPLGLVRAISADDAPSLARLRPDVSARVVAIVDRAIAKEPDARFPTAAAMSAALTTPTATRDAGDAPTLPVSRATEEVTMRRSLAATDVLAPPAAPAARPDRGLRHRKLRISLIAAVLGFVGLTTAAAVVVATRTDEPSAPTPTTPVQSTLVPAPLSRAIDDLDRAVRP